MVITWRKWNEFVFLKPTDSVVLSLHVARDAIFCTQNLVFE